ncbi:hypothetical protein [Nannocystis radixulma]|uniref:Uncharacterized protein n=1 Tax=Nannocystis radixulma TaxID=2995305 RepID=A0ABT5BNE3_9BACT|nr:hypothetical protein [Nannocystis radixulma]MDC0674451.1 hypothetical protein [Nannocystis radixulma]
MALKTSHHERALAAAAGLVGRPRLRAGLVLTLIAACGSGPNEGETDAASDGSTGASAADTTALVTTSSSAGGSEGLTGTGAEEATTTATTSTSGEATTTTSGEATLLTDATTLATTTSTSTSTSGETDSGATTDDGTGSTTMGELDDCVDMRTGEVDWVCCERQEWLPAPQCTPWGPPAPPAALGERLQRARAARGRWV